MSVGISNGLVGLTLLSGTNSLDAFGSTSTLDSFPVTRAKAALTLPATTPPWKLTTGTTTDSAQLSAIKRLTTLIDKSGSGTDTLPPDVQTSFTAYKALDRLRILAESAAKKTAGSAERAGR